MKNIKPILILSLVSLISISCDRVVSISFSPDISVELPNNYELTDGDSQFSPKSYTATIDEDQIYVMSVEVEALDTLSLKEKTKSIQINVDSYIQAFIGKQLTSYDTIIHGKIIKDFSYEFGVHDTVYFGYSRCIIEDQKFHLLSYLVAEPLNDKSLKRKDKFFNSIVIN